MIYASGSIPLDPKSMDIVPGGIEEQTVRPVIHSWYRALIRTVRSILGVMCGSDVVLGSRYIGHKDGRKME